MHTNLKCHGLTAPTTLISLVKPFICHSLTTPKTIKQLTKSHTSATVSLHQYQKQWQNLPPANHRFASPEFTSLILRCKCSLTFCCAKSLVRELLMTNPSKRIAQAPDQQPIQAIDIFMFCNAKSLVRQLLTTNLSKRLTTTAIQTIDHSCLAVQRAW